MAAKNDSILDIRITLNSIFVALVSFPLVLVFIVLSYKLITTAFVDDQVREDIESYIAVLGILSGPAYMVISRFFDRWNAEEEEYVESRRQRHKTENDLQRQGLKSDIIVRQEEE